MDNLALTKLGKEILSTAQGELYLSMRFLDVALSGLTFELNPLIQRTATDGEKLYFQPRFLLTAYEENPVIVNRAYLHSLIHCLFSHLYLPPKEKRALYDLCCDICAESLIDSLDYPCLKIISSSLREQTYQFISEQTRLYTPGKLYRLLDKSAFYRENGPSLEQEFTVDTHQFWPADNTQEREQQQNRQSYWQDVQDKTRTSMETFQRRAGTRAGNFLQFLRADRSGTRYDYFLKRFARLRESMRINPEEFDLAYYTLGMDLYGNVPLIEPLEYREEKKIRELVIAVDTSGSCQGRPVKKFLSETLAILQNSHSFFSHIRLHLLQFDTVIQDEKVITELPVLREMAESFQVKGFGGTDYRCVFDHLADRQAAGILRELQGLLILTDGYGTFPNGPPPYPTAFLLADFLNRDHTGAVAMDRVPSWAMRLRINEEELEEYI